MNTKPRLLLLNPPGKRVYLRDYFCSKVSQADYLNHPIDFVYLSGILGENYDVRLIDAIVDRLADRDTLVQIRDSVPHAIIGLIGSVSYEEDVAFYRLLHNELDVPLFLIGDVLIERREERLRELDFAEGFLHDFSTDAVHRMLRGDYDQLSNVTFRLNDRIVAAPIARPHVHDFILPVPRHELFLDKNYRYPFVRRKRFATVMTEVGCPYHCTFCIMGTLGWKTRPVHNVIEELEAIRQRDIHEVFFLDQTFASQRTRTLDLLAEMQRRSLDFGWVCFSRVDVLDDELLDAMKNAGCHTIILGLESGDDGVLAASRKGYTSNDVRTGFRRVASHGIRTVATVIIGLPEETEESFRRTLELLSDVSCDFASFNVAVPRMGTSLRRQALAHNLISSGLQVMDQSGHEVAMPTLTLSRERISAMHRRAVRAFYFDPGYLTRRLRRLRSMEDARIQLRQGYGLLKSFLARRFA